MGGVGAGGRWSRGGASLFGGPALDALDVLDVLDATRHQIPGNDSQSPPLWSRFCVAEASAAPISSAF